MSPTPSSLFPILPASQAGKRRIFHLLICFLGVTLLPLPGLANPVVQKIEKATPTYRVIHLIYYFDTCRAVTQNKEYAFEVLNEIENVGIRLRDKHLRRYVRYTRDTYGRNGDGTNQQKAELFLKVGKQATKDGDPEIAAVCQHFAGQYYFIAEDYGKAFQFLLIANRAFRSIGLKSIPPISRFLYELAFNYYHFHEFEKVIPLLREAEKFPPFSENLHIQTYNTMALSYAHLSSKDSLNRDEYIREAERNYLRSQQLAAQYRDSVWIGITAGNLGGLYQNQKRWVDALKAFKSDYHLGLKFGRNRYYPTSGALGAALAFVHLEQLDSCRYYLDRAKELYQLNLTMPDFARNLRDEDYLWEYYEIMRQYYKLVDNSRRASQYADSMFLMSDRIAVRSSARQLSLAEQKLLIQKYESEVEAIDAEKSNQQSIFWLIAIGLASLAGLFFRLLYLSRIRRRQEQEIEVAKEKSLRLEKQIVEDELQQAQIDLNGFVENLHQKNALIDALTLQLESLESGSLAKDDTQLNEARQKLMHSNLLTKNDWDEFQRRFERVHPGFFWQLRTQFPDISPAEERLLALSQLRLDTSQMSRMLGISPSSVHKTKYRLRKKLGLSANSPLSGLMDTPGGDPIIY
ncbi:hypothetical protein [Persicitalea jodogahamensis]|uniref:HTH luxR-type domain-containing protein n=1 Tax=Persicitalea jodogahamensis TaxID=402147 RepID=A0A8J3D7T3_9BACT|nr:hypothetical protein [Persicitalea jodogahamensis]GHB85755.1 hypothetical protein GCM10007390_46550 [Persicitalea jodogahamensis]